MVQDSNLVQYFPGVEFTQSMFGVIIAQTYIASPFMILASQVAFESVDESYEKVARSLGKNKLETFFRISLPLAKSWNNHRHHDVVGQSCWRAWRYHDDGIQPPYNLYSNL